MLIIQSNHSVEIRILETLYKPGCLVVFISIIKNDETTRQMSKARNFIGTLNNPDTTTCEAYLKAWKDVKGCTYATGQLEKGAEGTVHLQYFLNFDTQQRITALKKHCGKSHFEVVIKDNGAADYC